MDGDLAHAMRLKPPAKRTRAETSRTEITIVVRRAKRDRFLDDLSFPFLKDSQIWSAGDLGDEAARRLLSTQSGYQREIGNVLGWECLRGRVGPSEGPSR
jgi:hypothetical protein